jgi:hypothetical protein
MKRNRNCIWHCGRETKNISRICDLCWANRDAVYQARKAGEAAAGPDPKKVEAGKRSAAKKKAAIQQQVPTSELFTLN